MRLSRKAVKDVPRDKLTVFYDKAGRAWSPEGYARMVVRTNQGRVVSETMEIMGEQLGTDLVEISSHIGARPNCAPYRDDIFNRWEFKTPGYPLFRETKLRRPDGMKGFQPLRAYAVSVRSSIKQTFKTIPEKEKENKRRHTSFQQQQRAFDRSGTRFHERLRR